MLNLIQHLLRRYQTLNQVQGDVYSRFVSYGLQAYTRSLPVRQSLGA